MRQFFGFGHARGQLIPWQNPFHGGERVGIPGLGVDQCPAKRDAAGAKRFFRRALSALGNPVPGVINVDKNPAYPAAVEALKAEQVLPRRVRLRQCKYLNNIVEQDHRTVKKRARLGKGYGSFQSAWRTLQGIETMHMINKGRVRWLAKGDAVGQAHFVASLFGIAA